MVLPATFTFEVRVLLRLGRFISTLLPCPTLPNQIANVRVQDYAANTVTIPVNTLQNDDKGKFVMVALKEGGKMIARKRYITVGEMYGEELEVKSGLQDGEQLITEGFQNLYDGQLVTTA